MYIREVELKNFRNYEHLNLKFNENVNFIIGNNAQGKTNLLESIFICSMGKSFRTSKDAEMIRFEKDFSKIKVTAQKQLFPVDVEITLRKDQGKSIKVNGMNISRTSDLLENLYIVIFSTEDLKIVKDEPEKRRKFIDRELCQIKPSYYDNLNRYKKALLQRNAYLKEPRIDEGVLEIWDAELAQYGSQIIAQRNEFIKKLSKISSQIHHGITNHKECLEIFYEPSIQTCENQKQIFIEELQKCRRRDIRNRTTGKGPHKDDLQLKANGIDIRNFGSQGQQRTAALSLKLSEIRLIREETGENPILLLDDVLSELDQERQNFLIRSLSDTQIFITTTEISRQAIQSLGEIRYFNIENGKIIS